MSGIIQIKVQYGTTKWENLPVHEMVEVNDSLEAQTEAMRVARINEKPVRWNWHGSSQGHYVDGYGQASHEDGVKA